MTRRDKYGEPVSDDEAPVPDAAPDVEHFCNGGWLGEDEDGRPIPCATCRPHLARMIAAERARLEGTR